jgi:hypothetical protein
LLLFSFFFFFHNFFIRVKRTCSKRSSLHPMSNFSHRSITVSKIDFFALFSSRKALEYGIAIGVDHPHGFFSERRAPLSSLPRLLPVHVLHAGIQQSDWHRIAISVHVLGDVQRGFRGWP